MADTRKDLKEHESNLAKLGKRYHDARLKFAQAVIAEHAVDDYREKYLKTYRTIAEMKADPDYEPVIVSGGDKLCH